MTDFALASVEDFFKSIFGSPSGFVETTGVVVASLLAAAGLGLAVCALYLANTRHRVRTPGFANTLILLTMLIAFVSLAIGSDAARAFTLVGTLSIVRFRTPVRDIRDTGFVIFAVAVGIALGAANFLVAVIGTAVIGSVILVMSRNPNAKEEDVGLSDAGFRLFLRMDGSGRIPEEISRIIASHTRLHQVMSIRDGRDGGLRVSYALDIEREHCATLIEELRVVEGVRRATLSFDNPEDDES